MVKNLTPAAFLAILNKDARTAADIDNASAYLKRSAYQRALWVDVRIGTDGADGATVADEAGVGASRISQIRYGVNLMRTAGIPMPTTLEEVTTSEHTYLTVSSLYKVGKNTRAALKAAGKRADGIADIDGKHAALCAVLPQDGDDTRAPRPNDGTTTTETDDDRTGTPATAHTVTERESTLVERMRAILADVKNGPIADIESVMTLANEISDAIAERADATIPA